MNRRAFLRLASMLAASAAVSACAPKLHLRDRLFDSLPAPSDDNPFVGPGTSFSGWDDGAVFTALSRLTFGPRVEERLRASAIGVPAWVEEQLAPAAIEDSTLDLRLRGFETLTMSPGDLFDASSRLFDQVDRTAVPSELRQATLLRQVFSHRQLYELMVEFWSDHFNISVDKGECWFLKTVDDREVIRKHALGNFGELLSASAHSPAMLVYLDNQASHKGAPNENYARELMELHALGIGGGYTQADVMALARCLTGWTVKDHFWRGEFTFDGSRHDDSQKIVLGMRVEPAGQREAEGVIELMTTHPSTARFISRKLAQRFIGPAAPNGVVERATQTFITTRGDIQAVLRVIVLDGLAFSEPKFKRPVNFVASALRQLGAQTDCGPALLRFLERMGQLPFGWPTPDGYPDRIETWQANMLARWQFALALAQDQIDGTRLNWQALGVPAGRYSPQAWVDHISALLLGTRLDPVSRTGLLTVLESTGDAWLPAVLAAGVMASPAFQWR